MVYDKSFFCEDERCKKEKCFKCDERNRCWLLDNTIFKNKKCPFYKSIDQAEADRKRWR